MFIFEGGLERRTMKKFLLIVFMFLMVIPVKGLEGNENIIRKYKYYRLNKVLGPMVFKNGATEEYPLIDESIYTEGKLSDLLIDKPEEKVGRKIYEYDGFHYLEIPKINIIEIKIDADSLIYNIDFKDNNGKLNYKLDDSVNNDNYYRYKLENEVNINDLIILAKSGNKDINSFTIYLKNEDTLVSEMHITTFENRDLKLLCSMKDIKKNAYKDIYTLNKLDLNNNLIYVDEVKLYQYQDYKYQSYKLEREYYDEYLSEPFEDYIYRDEDNYIDISVNYKDLNNTLPIKENKAVSKENNFKKLNNNVKPLNTNNIPNTSDESSVNTSAKKKTHYQHVLKMSNDKTKSNKTNDNNLYNYLKLFVLIILLILTIKLKNKVKEYSR